MQRLLSTWSELNAASYAMEDFQLEAIDSVKELKGWSIFRIDGIPARNIKDDKKSLIE